MKYFQEKIFDLAPLEIGNIVNNSTIFNNNIEIIEVLNFFKIIELNIKIGELNFKEEFFTQKYGYNISAKTPLARASLLHLLHESFATTERLW
ncbi:hypothetical protein [uncultured Chryseobacterium sp.]|uniref:hypothetical protein n=1 Tax=uncultured Chryseobacterium sp. TaxID=259322 RepID=UPI0025F52112|nr:hypothetical protein [uncultured Chryseobacterium sp.]